MGAGEEMSLEGHMSRIGVTEKQRREGRNSEGICWIRVEWQCQQDEMTEEMDWGFRWKFSITHLEFNTWDLQLQWVKTNMCEPHLQFRNSFVYRELSRKQFTFSSISYIVVENLCFIFDCRLFSQTDSFVTNVTASVAEYHGDTIDAIAGVNGSGSACGACYIWTDGLPALRAEHGLSSLSDKWGIIKVWQSGSSGKQTQCLPWLSLIPHAQLTKVGSKITYYKK